MRSFVILHLDFGCFLLKFRLRPSRFRCKTAMMRFRDLAVLTSGLVAFCQSACLTSSDVVPEADRVDITINGQSMPIGLSGPEWDSAKLYSKIAEIITKEILGFKTTVGPHGDGSPTSYKLAAEGNSIHFLSEIWSSFSQEIVQFEQQNPELALPLLKNLDYSGADGMNIFPKSYQPYYETYGKSLEFYQYFNASVLRLTNEFASITTFDLNSLSACDAAEAGAEIEKTYYLDATGDSGAFVNGAWQCHQGKWWLAPACRSTPNTCVPLLTHKYWGWNEMRQKAAAYYMPIAMASTPSADIYLQWPKDRKMLVLEIVRRLIFSFRFQVRTFIPKSVIQKPPNLSSLFRRFKTFLHPLRHTGGCPMIVLLLKELRWCSSLSTILDFGPQVIRRHKHHRRHCTLTTSLVLIQRLLKYLL